MPKSEFTKEFKTALEDFNNATQRAIGLLAGKDSEEEEEEKEEIEIDDLYDTGLDRLFVRTRKDFLRFDAASKELDSLRKEYEKENRERNAKAVQGTGAPPPPVNLEEEQAHLLEPFKDAAERLEKSLEAFTLRVRSQFVGRKDLGPKFSHAANELFLDLKKLDTEVDKFVATELKRKPKEEKPLEVIPSKFMADFKADLKKDGPDDPDDKQKKLLKELEDRLKRIDTNHSFSKVTSLCETAQSGITDVLKSLGKDEPKFTKDLKELHAAIEKYDNHMFLLSRM